jgi:hypothetical protein
MPGDTPVYVERYRWTPTLALGVAVDLAFVFMAVFFIAPLFIRIPVMAVFGWFAVISVATALSRRIALRVDETGVTFGGGPFRYGATTRSHPWRDIESIILWKRYLPFSIGRWTPFSFGPIEYIGLRRRPGAPRMTEGARARADWPGYMTTVKGIVAGAARNIVAFVLDKDRLGQAVVAFGPTVAINDGAIVGKAGQPIART